MDPKIKKLLQKNGVKYKIIEHRKVYTAFNEAETTAFDPKIVIKTVYVKFSKPVNLIIQGKKVLIDSALVAIQAKKRVDFKKVAKTINDHQLQSYKILAKLNQGQKRSIIKQAAAKKPTNVIVKMANEKDIAKKLKTKVGLLSAFSQIYGLPLLFDKKLEKNKKLILAAGSYTESLEVSTKDFMRINPGIAGNFTE